MNRISKGVVIGGAIVASVGGFASLASAHTPNASANCRGVQASGTAYDPSDSNTYVITLDGETKSGSFQTSFSDSIANPGGNFTWAVSITSSGDPDGSKGWTKAFRGHTENCAPKETPAPTTTIAVTTTTNTVPDTTEEATTTTNTVPEEEGPTTTCKSYNSATGGCNPDTPPNACLSIDPATGLGHTSGHFLPCGPGFNPCAESPSDWQIVPGPDGEGTTCVPPDVSSSQPVASDVTTTTVFVPGGTLPETGMTATIAIVAAFVTALGITLVLVRRRPKTAR